MLRRLVGKGLELSRVLTSPARMSPGFLIIGAAKAGTTSLYDCLTQHPSIVPARTKEIHYFDLRFNKGNAWYRSHFALRTRLRSGASGHDRLITGEASPYYLFHPSALSRIAEALPSVRLIVLLRNPVDRAYSQYQHCVRLGYENLPFEEAIAAEAERLAGEVEKVRMDANYFSFNHQYFSYLTRGIYADQLQRLWELGFAEQRVMILKSEDFFARPAECLTKLWKFLELPDHKLGSLQKMNNGNYDQMASETRQQLLRFFEPHNNRLDQLLGRSFDWS